MQMPRPWMGTQVAPLGQPPPAGPGLQMSAHCDGEEEPGVSRTHSPLAVAPLWVSAGHGEVGPHLGEQNEPVRRDVVVARVVVLSDSADCAAHFCLGRARRHRGECHADLAWATGWMG